VLLAGQHVAFAAFGAVAVLLGFLLIVLNLLDEFAGAVWGRNDRLLPPDGRVHSSISKFRANMNRRGFPPSNTFCERSPIE